MSRPRVILAALLVCLGVALAAMAWVSAVVVALDRRDAAAQRQAELEENARLALWRMESALSPLVAQEQGRRFHEYLPFHAPPLLLDHAHQPVGEGDVVLPSPLLTHTPPFVRLHFQIDAAGQVTSPQVPEIANPGTEGPGLTSAERVVAAAEALSELSAHLDPSTLLAAAPEPDEWSRQSGPAADSQAKTSAEQVAVDASQADAPQWLSDLYDSNSLAQSSLPVDLRKSGRARNAAAQQVLRSNTEYQQRVEANFQSKLLGKFNRDMDSRNRQDAAMGDAEAQMVDAAKALPPALAQLAIEGDMQPLWVGERLLLVRRVMLGDQTWLQGCWLDWDKLRSWLVQRVTDLLPEAELVPVAGQLRETDPHDPYLLASLPARLNAGTIDGKAEQLSAPIRTSLIVAWLCTLSAAVAVAALGVGMTSLSERRAAFVSAVTHELRTPLTTFRMYTEMLAGGMIKEEARRREYLATLHDESERLARLIENVLSYARLERNRAVSHTENVTLGAMIDRFAVRLRQRAAQAEMDLDICLGEDLREAVVHTDPSAVEQIISNLVDNACKYAAEAEDRRIRVDAQIDGRWLRLRVSDHGRGVGEDVARRLFEPFCRSAQDAANTAPGVGLGLALSRRLARRLGGDLRLVESGPDGSCFELKLPV